MVCDMVDSEDVAFDDAGLCSFRDVADARREDRVPVVCQAVFGEETDKTLFESERGLLEACRDDFLLALSTHRETGSHSQLICMYLAGLDCSRCLACVEELPPTLSDSKQILYSHCRDVDYNGDSVELRALGLLFPSAVRIVGGLSGQMLDVARPEAETRRKILCDRIEAQAQAFSNFHRVRRQVTNNSLLLHFLSI